MYTPLYSSTPYKAPMTQHGRSLRVPARVLRTTRMEFMILASQTTHETAVASPRNQIDMAQLANSGELAGRTSGRRAVRDETVGATIITPYT